MRGSQYYLMSATTIASYGQNGQKDVYLLARETGGKSETCETGGAGEMGGIQFIHVAPFSHVSSFTRLSILPGLLNAHRRFAELMALDRRLGEIDGAGGTL